MLARPRTAKFNLFPNETAIQCNKWKVDATTNVRSAFDVLRPLKISHSVHVWLGERASVTTGRRNVRILKCHLVKLLFDAGYQLINGSRNRGCPEIHSGQEKTRERRRLRVCWLWVEVEYLGAAECTNEVVGLDDFRVWIREEFCRWIRVDSNRIGLPYPTLALYPLWPHLA